MKKLLEDEEIFSVYCRDELVALIYALYGDDDGRPKIWAMTGSRKPFLANTDDFVSFDDAMAYVRRNLYLH